MGLAEGPTWSIMTALIEESSPPSRRGRNIGIVVSAAALVGLAIAPVMTTQLAVRYGWRWAFFAAGIPGLLAGILIWKYVKEPARLVGGGSHKIQIASYFSILRIRNMWLCCIGAIGFVGWLFLLSVFAPLFITEMAHQTATMAGFLLGATGLGSFILGFLLPALSDRWGRKSVLMMMGLLSAVVPLVLLIQPLYAHPWLLVGIIFCTNAGQGIPALVMVLIPTESVGPRLSATSIGLASLMGEIFGATAAPMIGGALAQSYGLAAPMCLSAACAFLVFVVAIFLKETTPAKRQSE